MGGTTVPSKILSIAQQHELNVYYIGVFAALLVALLVFRSVARVGKGNGDSAANGSPLGTASGKSVASPEFIAFQRKYVLVYLFMMAADWLQGPYVYALYTHYGYNISQIGVLFIVGFGSSLLFGTIVGSMADKYGRKRLCCMFGVLYSISCLTKHSGQYRILLLGRLLGGISTSILFSSFESWLVHEHHALGYSDELLGATFSLCTSANGVIAIVSGIVASSVRDVFGPVAPFDVSLVCLVLGTGIILSTWRENTGNASIDLQHTLQNAFDRLRHDRKIALLGMIQSFFEGSMYVFVFMWTPALESTSVTPIYHGWIFASFMICTLIGSGIFQYCIEQGYRVEKIALQMFVCSAVSLLLPAFTSIHSVRLLSFCAFEVCVGMFWPCLGCMRSKYVPEDVRATTMNFFRIPLNLIVCLVLGKIGEMSEMSVFGVCTCCLLIAIVCQYQLCQIVFERSSDSLGIGNSKPILDPGMEEKQPLTSSH